MILKLHNGKAGVCLDHNNLKMHSGNKYPVSDKAFSITV